MKRKHSTAPPITSDNSEGVTGSSSPQSKPDALSAAELRAVDEAIAEEFPLAAPAMEVVLIDVDPTRLHAVWNLNLLELAQGHARIRSAKHAQHLVLRVREIESCYGGHPIGLPSMLYTFDYPIVDGEIEAEFQVPGAGRCYEAELGITAEDGGWRSLSRSNQIQMPPSGPSEDLATKMLDLRTLSPDAESVVCVSPITCNELADGKRQNTTMEADPEVVTDLSLKAGPPDSLKSLFPNTLPAHEAPMSELQTLPSMAAEVPVRSRKSLYAEQTPTKDLPSSVGLSSTQPARTLAGHFLVNACDLSDFKTGDQD